MKGLPKKVNLQYFSSMKMYMKMYVLLFGIIPLVLGTYTPGTPGGNWTENQAKIIRQIFQN